MIENFVLLHKPTSEGQILLNLEKNSGGKDLITAACSSFKTTF